MHTSITEASRKGYVTIVKHQLEGQVQVLGGAKASKGLEFREKYVHNGFSSTRGVGFRYQVIERMNDNM